MPSCQTICSVRESDTQQQHAEEYISLLLNISAPPSGVFPPKLIDAIIDLYTHSVNGYFEIFAELFPILSDFLQKLPESTFREFRIF